MTRRDYVLLAHTMRAVRPDAAFKDMRHQWCTDILALATALRGTNPRFERDRFVIACGAEACDSAYGVTHE